MGVTRFEEASFISQPDISIDYAVMEKAEKIYMVPRILVGRMSAAGTLRQTRMRLIWTAIVLLMSIKFILLRRGTRMSKAQVTPKNSSLQLA